MAFLRGLQETQCHHPQRCISASTERVATDELEGGSLVLHTGLDQWVLAGDSASRGQGEDCLHYTCGPLSVERMPLGLCNAPLTFQWLMHWCLSEQVYDYLLIWVM